MASRHEDTDTQMGDKRNQAVLAGFDSYDVKLGDELRGERATLGKSLLDVQRDLRIKAAYIAAIEDCDAEVFPNKGFVSGYVKAYSRYLKLDADMVFARFCAESGFEGINADLKRSTTSTKTKVLYGPVVAQKDDAIWRTVMPVEQSGNSILGQLSLSSIASLFVFLTVLGGLGYGAMAVINDIQRVDIAPINQDPTANSEVASLTTPGLTTQTIELTGDTALQTTNDDLTRLYQPRELDVPVLESRDGPIVEIDPEQSGTYAALPDRKPASEPAVGTVAFEMGDANDPRVRERIAPPQVLLVAARPAWVRVYERDGTVILEKILEGGEAYTLPADTLAPMLRAGNSGSLYVMVDKVAYGPVGKGTSVAKNVSLSVQDILATYAEIEKTPEILEVAVSELDKTAVVSE